jgi:hypothetical protein
MGMGLRLLRRTRDLTPEVLSSLAPPWRVGDLPFYLTLVITSEARDLFFLRVVIAFTAHPPVLKSRNSQYLCLSVVTTICLIDYCYIPSG